MSRQSSIDSYFTTSKANTPSITGGMNVKNISAKKMKKRSLSLIKPSTPTKSPKVSSNDRNVQDVINLCTDDEEELENFVKLENVSMELSLTPGSASSDMTISYSLTPETPQKITQKHQRSQQSPQVDNTPQVLPQMDRTLERRNEETLEINLNLQATPIKVETLQETQPLDQTPQESSQMDLNVQTTPIKDEILQDTSLMDQTSENYLQMELILQETTRMSQKTPVKAGPSSEMPALFRSPLSQRKFYSPTKKRLVNIRTPTKVKRSLSSEFSCAELTNLANKELFTNACEGMDDKTICHLAMINKYLNDPSLCHLLDEDSQTLLSCCMRVLKPGMRLVCRLYWRKEGWYKHEQISKICSEEKEPLDDPRMHEMLLSVREGGLIELGNMNTMNFDDFKAVLNKNELKEICKDLKINVNSKQDAMDALLSFSKRTVNISNFLNGPKTNNSERVLKMMSEKAGSCYKLSNMARKVLYKLYVLMYLGIDYTVIRDKKLEFVLIYDKIGRETYPVDKGMTLDNASVVFKTRDDFTRYMAAHYIYEDFLMLTDLNVKCQIIGTVYFDHYKQMDEDERLRYKNLPIWLRRYTPAYLYVKILEAGVQVLKKGKLGGHDLLALNILTSLISQNEFRQHKKAEWFAEKALVLHSLSRYDEAAEVLLEGFKSDMSEEEKDSMRPRAKKIANQKNIALSEHLKKEVLEYATKEAILENSLGGDHVYKQPMERNERSRGKVKFESRTPQGRDVLDAEEYCAAHYISTGDFNRGEHWEGRIVTTIFFLLFWDIIYAKPAGCPGVFLCYYQQFPLDLFYNSFYINRRKMIDDWLDVIERSTEDKLLKIMHETWRIRPEREMSGVSRSIGWENIREVSSCLGPRALAAICRRLATNYKYSHSGFPDLTLWHTDTKRIKFVEVKTDSDKPSMKQIQWMQYLRESGVETGFCYLGVNTTRQRCRPAQTH